MKTKYQIGDLVRSVGARSTQRVGIVVATVADNGGYRVHWNESKQFNIRNQWVRGWQLERVH